MAELKIISMDEVQSKEVNWLWYPYIPYGKITIIQGDPGLLRLSIKLPRTDWKIPSSRDWNPLRQTVRKLKS